MIKKTNLKEVFLKVNVQIQGDYLLVSCGELVATLDKKKFINTLFEEYKNLIKTELELEESEELNLTFDTDFAGCLEPFLSPTFKIQDDDNNGNSNVLFIFWHQSERDSEEMPKTIEINMTWEETKLWTELVLILGGKGKEMSVLEEKIINEVEKENALHQEIMSKRTTFVDDISIFPNSIIEYHSVWVDFCGEMIPIEVSELTEISELLSEFNMLGARVDDIYNSGKHLSLYWDDNRNKVNFQIKSNQLIIAYTFLEGDDIKKLHDEINRISPYV